MIVTLSSKGQLVIPKAIRSALGLRSGSQFNLELEDNRIVLEPRKGDDVIEALYGIFGDDDFLSDLEEEHRLELEGDERQP